MTIPEDKLSSQAVIYPMFGGRAGAVGRQVDHEDGPRYLQDPTWGILDQIWGARMVSAGIMLGCNTVEDFIAYAVPSASEFSFTFDQNGRYAIAYVENDLSYLYWYDTQLGSYALMDIYADLGVTMITPKLFLDDKRVHFNYGNDMLLFYLEQGSNGKKLCYRQQRDRWLVEMPLVDPVPASGIARVGMQKNLRIQIKMEK